MINQGCEIVSIYLHQQTGFSFFITAVMIWGTSVLSYRSAGFDSRPWVNLKCFIILRKASLDWHSCHNKLLEEERDWMLYTVWDISSENRYSIMSVNFPVVRTCHVVISKFKWQENMCCPTLTGDVAKPAATQCVSSTGGLKELYKLVHS